MLYSGKAVVTVYTNYIVAYVQQDIADYYRSLIPKAKYVKGQRYKAHITIVRLNVETFGKSASKFNGKIINFDYSPVIHTDDTYYWLNAYSDDIGDIRADLNLLRIRYGSYHITIGNTKDEI